MFIKKCHAANIFVFRSMDWGGGRAIVHHSMNGGRGICQQKLLAGLGIRPVLSISRGLPRVLPEKWMLADGTASHHS